MTNIILAQWPDSKHVVPLERSANETVNGRPVRFPFRVLTEDEYQLLLAGFRAAGGKVYGDD